MHFFSLLALLLGAAASDIPFSRSTVDVRVINPNIARNVPPNAFFTPVINGTVMSETPFYVFLIEHKGRDGKMQRVLFDLGVRKDIKNSVPSVAETVETMGVRLDTPKDTPETLVAGGVPLESIDSIFWSHWHFDHIGDASLFPKKVDINVGPGFRQAFMPGYPINLDSPIKQDAFEGRRVNELNFASSRINIGGFQALDWFGDGSFFVIQTPGHAIGHISALARTTTDTFVLMGGDVCHHAGALRPNRYTQLPKDIKPSPFSLLSSGCVGEFAQNVHPKHSRTEPFMEPVEGGFNMNNTAMKETLGIVQRFDANPNVFVMIAHDASLLGVIDLFPKSVNAWKAKGWRETTRWAFVKDFAVY